MSRFLCVGSAFGAIFFATVLTGIVFFSVVLFGFVLFALAFLVISTPEPALDCLAHCRVLWPARPLREPSSSARSGRGGSSGSGRAGIRARVRTMQIRRQEARPRRGSSSDPGRVR